MYNREKQVTGQSSRVLYYCRASKSLTLADRGHLILEIRMVSLVEDLVF
jgi:hypothetical protein